MSSPFAPKSAKNIVTRLPGGDDPPRRQTTCPCILNADSVSTARRLPCMLFKSSIANRKSKIQRLCPFLRRSDKCEQSAAISPRMSFPRRRESSPFSLAKPQRTQRRPTNHQQLTTSNVLLTDYRQPPFGLVLTSQVGHNAGGIRGCGVVLGIVEGRRQAKRAKFRLTAYNF